jgi:hypothetical protein
MIQSLKFEHTTHCFRKRMGPLLIADCRGRFWRNRPVNKIAARLQWGQLCSVFDFAFDGLWGSTDLLNRLPHSFRRDAEFFGPVLKFVLLADVDSTGILRTLRCLIIRH